MSVVSFWGTKDFPRKMDPTAANPDKTPPAAISLIDQIRSSHASFHLPPKPQQADDEPMTGFA